MATLGIKMINRRDNLDPSHWGPLTWQVLFLFALSYPDLNTSKYIKNNFAAFYNSLKVVLPCEKCREGTAMYFKKLPIEKHLDTKISLLKWVIGLYNDKRPIPSKMKTLKDLKKTLKADKETNILIDNLDKNNPKLRF